ncbi:MAG: histidine phosphatase family protein [bacterium]|nr:histidine phosphatase family protein [Gammaproteobacteria bacterium]HIL96772.1 histidine phosphatase family protein [Pseudomonadales bacterium]
MYQNIKHLIFVRHGESEHYVKGLTGGWTDTPLTPRGRAQITITATRLLEWKLQKVAFYCSDLIRAVQSADIIGSTIGCVPTPLAGLREISNGVAANLSLREAEQIQSYEPELADLDWRPYDKAETWREMSARVDRALAIFDKRADTVLVVGHGNSGQALANAWLGIPVANQISFRFATASISEFRINRWGEQEIVHSNISYDA